MPSFSLGISRHYNPQIAVKEALVPITARASHPPKQIWLFAQQGHYDPQNLITELKRQTGQSKVIGTTVGSPLQTNLGSNCPLVLLALNIQESTLGMTSQHSLYRDAQSFASHLWQGLDHSMGSIHPQWALVIPPAGIRDLATIVQSLTQDLHAVQPLWGGVLGPDDMTKATWQFFERQPLQHNLLMSSASSPSNVHLIVSNPWQAVGQIQKPTAVQNGMISQINHVPAVEFYTKQLGLNLNPGINPDNQPNWLWRYPLIKRSLSQGDQVMIPRLQRDGSLVSLLPVSSDDSLVLASLTSHQLRTSTLAACQALRDQLLTQPPQLVIGFSSMARHSVTLDEGEQELKLITEVFGPDMPTLLLRTYAEIAPPKPNFPSSVMQGSFVIAGIS